MQPHQRLLLLPVVHRLLPAQRAMRHGLAELGQRVVGLRPLGQAATAVDEVAEHGRSAERARNREATTRFLLTCWGALPADNTRGLRHDP